MDEEQRGWQYIYGRLFQTRPPSWLSRALSKAAFHLSKGRISRKKNTPKRVFFWWGKMDSNHRRHCQQIYSLSPLATREFPHMNLWCCCAAFLAARPNEVVVTRKGRRKERMWSFRLPAGSATQRVSSDVMRAHSDAGAGRRTRTPDLLITNQLLYQLSYTSTTPA